MKNPSPAAKDPLAIISGFLISRLQGTPNRSSAHSIDHSHRAAQSCDSEQPGRDASNEHTRANRPALPTLSSAHSVHNLVPDQSVDDVIIEHPLVTGQTATINVVGGCDGFLNTWIDFNGLGQFSQNNRLLADWPVSKGDNQLSIDVPKTIGMTVCCRFLFSSTPLGSVSHPERIMENATVIDRNLGSIVDVIDESDVKLFRRRDNIAVYLLDARSLPVCDSNRNALWTRTDAMGRYSFRGLPDAEYQIVVGNQLRFDGQHEATQPVPRPAIQAPMESRTATPTRSNANHRFAKRISSV